MKTKLSEKIYRAKKEITRIWYEAKEANNNTVFKIGVKYSYIVDEDSKTVKIVPYDKKYKTRGTVSKRKNGEMSIIDICNKTIKELFADFKQYKITVFEDEIFIEGYDESKETSIQKLKNVLNFRAKKKASRKVIKLPVNQLQCLMKASGLEGQMNFFDLGFSYSTEGFADEDSSEIINSTQFKKDKPIVNKTVKLLSLFSGIGAFEEGLKNIGQSFELTNYCEFQSHIAESYSIIHNEPISKNLGDVTKVDETKLDDFDIMTFGSPCQDLSSLGSQKGFFDESGEKTRSGLFLDAIRIMKHKRPKVAIIENVRALVSVTMKDSFEKMKELISDMGYNFYHTVMNTKNYGLPHSRNRFFGVCIRKDIDTNKFAFPEKQPLTSKASDYYDDSSIISEDHYLEEKHHKYFNEMRLKKKYSSLNSDVIICMTTKQGQKSNPQNFVLDDKGYRILTAREMFALQGFKKEDADKLLANGIKTSQIGYMCGNTISVCIIEHLFRSLIKALPNVFGSSKVVPIR